VAKLPQWSRRVLAFDRGWYYVRILPRLGFKVTTRWFVLAYDWHFGWSRYWVK
jgi:hypothetical protein